MYFLPNTLATITGNAVQKRPSEAPSTTQPTKIIAFGGNMKNACEDMARTVHLPMLTASHAHVSRHACAHVYAHVRAHVCMHVYMHVHAHVCAQIDAHADVRADARVDTHVCTHVYTHVDTHVYIQAPSMTRATKINAVGGNTKTACDRHRHRQLYEYVCRAMCRYAH